MPRLGFSAQEEEEESRLRSRLSHNTNTNISLFMRVDASHSHHSTSFLTLGPPQSFAEAFGLVRAELCNPELNEVFTLSFICDVIFNYRDKSSLRGPDKLSVNTKQRIAVATVSRALVFCRASGEQ